MEPFKSAMEDAQAALLRVMDHLPPNALPLMEAAVTAIESAFREIMEFNLQAGYAAGRKDEAEDREASGKGST